MTRKTFARKKGLLSIKAGLIFNFTQDPSYQSSNHILYEAMDRWEKHIADHLSSHQEWIESNGKYGRPFDETNEYLQGHLDIIRFLTIPIRFPIGSDLSGMDLRFLKGFYLDFENCNLHDVKLILDRKLLCSLFQDTKQTYTISFYDEEETNTEVFGFTIDPQKGKMKTRPLYPGEQDMVLEGMAKQCDFKKLFKKTLSKRLVSRQKQATKRLKYETYLNKKGFRMNM